MLLGVLCRCLSRGAVRTTGLLARPLIFLLPRIIFFLLLGFPFLADFFEFCKGSHVSMTAITRGCATVGACTKDLSMAGCVLASATSVDQTVGVSTNTQPMQRVILVRET